MMASFDDFLRLHYNPFFKKVKRTALQNAEQSFMISNQ